MEPGAEPEAGPEPEAPTLTAREALRRAAPLLGRRPILIVSDFDGTIAQIKIDPWAAAIDPAARRALRRLAALDGVVVAFLSGRTALDLAGRARVGGARYLGNHGMERAALRRGARAETLDVDLPDASGAPGRMAELVADGVPRLVTDAWLVVERKPPAVAFHYRGAPDVAAAGERVRGAVDRLDPDALLERFQGKRVLELRPAGAPGKDDAVRALIDEVRPRACFLLGDDRTDAAAFAILSAARAEGRTNGLAIGVHGHHDVAPDVARWADVMLASPIEAGRFLAGLARLLGATARQPRARD